MLACPIITTVRSLPPKLAATCLREDNSVPNRATWQFPPRNGGADYVHDSAGAHFGDAPIRKMVREAIQNSLDAKKDRSPGPVKVTFEETSFPSNLIGAGDLRRHIESCLKRAKDEKLTAIRPHYEKALRVLKSSRVRSLRIVDSGTTGLKSSNWNALVLQEGAVQKQTPSPGGSVGTGKNAAFNVSDLRSVFYSTRYVDLREGRVEKLQGKAVLMAHPDPADAANSLQHIGFFALPEAQPVMTRSIPQPFRLDEVGTGVFILGFNPRSPNWGREVTIAAIENFFHAIHNRRLVVTVSHGGSVRLINHENLDSLFQELAPKSQYYSYYVAIRDRQAAQTPRIKSIGRLNVYLSLGSGPSRTAYINRNGMLITDSREQKTNPIAPRRSSLWPDFSAVVVPDSDSGDQWIRRTENPSHDSMSYEQLPEYQESLNAQKSFRAAREAIRKIIDEAAKVDSYGDISNLDELASMFPDEFDPTSRGNRILLTRESSTRPPVGMPTPGEPEIRTEPEGGPGPGPGPGPNPNPNPNPPGPGPGPRPGPNPRPGRGQTRRPRLDQRRFIPTGARSAIVAFTSVENPPQPVQIALIPAGSEYGREEKVEIVEATVLSPNDQELKLEDGVISITSRPGERVLMKITTEETIDARAFKVG